MAENSSTAPGMASNNTYNAGDTNDAFTAGGGSDVVNAGGGDDRIAGDGPLPGQWTYALYTKDFTSAAGQTGTISSGTLQGTGYVDDFNVLALRNTLSGAAQGTNQDDFGVIYQSTLNIQASGTYTFGVTSDDGSRIIIRDSSGNIVFNLDNDREQPATTATGTVNLQAGDTYSIELYYWENQWGQQFGATIAGPGFGTTDLSTSPLIGTPPLAAGHVDGSDTLYGQGGSDTLSGGGGNDTIYGGTENDSLLGEAGSDRLFGEAGNDTLYGGSGADSLFGGLNDDTLYGGTENDSLSGNEGSDLLFGEAGNDTLLGDDGDDTLVGGAGSDLLSGGTGRDTADYSGSTLGVNVNLATGQGSGGDAQGDTLTGMDNVIGSAFGDTLTAHNTQGDLYGGGGSDVLYGGTGDGDRLYGGDGNDTLSGNSGADLLYGGAGDDSVGGHSGEEGNDTLFGGTGNDSLNGGGGNDLVYGDAGSDTLSGGVGADTLYGGDDGDQFWLNDNHQTDTVFGGEGGNDYDYLGLWSSTAGVGVAVTFTGSEAGTYTYGGGASGTFAQIEGMWTTLYNDSIDASASTTAQGIDGLAGDDTIIGGSGWDWLVGGDGRDSIVGGGGGDQIFAGADNDSVQAGTGDDTVYGGTGADSLSGDAGADVLYGEAGNDTLFGGTENDTLFGGTEADWLAGDDGSDLLYGDAGVDTLVGGIGNDRLFGGTEADSLSGDAGNDLIDGGAGADTIHGGEGNDTVFAGSEDDSVFGGDGADSILGGAGRDYLLFGSGDDTVYGGSEDDFIDDAEGTQLSGSNLVYGGDGRDTVYTGFDADTVHGDAGDDMLAGEGGDDLLYGGAGADQVYGGDGRDTIVMADGDFAWGDFVDGGSGGDDFDVLDLSGYGWARTDVAYSSAESGTVTFYDADGAVLGTMNFVEIEKVVPCFTAGTLIDTPSGPRPVESLRPGDLVATLDDGLQPVRWVGQRRLGLAELLADPGLQPVEIAADALAAGVPERAVQISPQHRVLFGGSDCELYFGTEEVLVPAIQMVGRAGIARRLQPVTYVHIMFDRHQIVRTHGLWSESFQPGDRVLEGMPDPQRDELRKLFPELSLPGAYPAARMTLKGYESRVLLQA